MKAVLMFNLNVPEEEAKFRRAQNADRYAGVLRAMDTELRNRLKYNKNTKQMNNALTGIRDLLSFLCAEAEVALED